MDLQNTLTGAASLCLAAAFFVFLFRTSKRHRKMKESLDQMEKMLEENKPEGIDKD